MMVATTVAILCLEKSSTSYNGGTEIGKNLGSNCLTAKPKSIVGFFFYME